MDLRIEKLFEDIKTFSISENNSYTLTYKEFLKYFTQIEKIEYHHLIISSHFVYGWMPTIIQFQFSDIQNVLVYLNAAKKGDLLTQNQLAAVKYCVNNSMVGASKLLHFINPQLYAIWDSRIFRYLTGSKYGYGIDKTENYLKYLDLLDQIKTHVDYKDLHLKIEEKISYNVSPLRAIEILMFETDRKVNLKTSVSQAD